MSRLGCRVLVITGLLTAVVAAQEPPALQRNPFARPVVADPSRTEAPAAAVEQPVIWRPQLRGVLRGRDGGIANLDGHLVAVGESIEGYRLVNIDERSATLARGRERLHISMDDAPEAADDAR